MATKMKKLLTLILIELIKINQSLAYWSAYKGGGSYDTKMSFYHADVAKNRERIKKLEDTIREPQDGK